MSEADLELYGIVGKMLREIREDKGYSLEVGAEYLDIAPKSLQRYECGERKIKVGTIKALCEFYNIDYDTFITEAILRFGRTSDEPTQYTCPECGFSYSADSPREVEEHEKEHSAYLKASKKFGKIYANSILNERIKARNRGIVKNLDLSLNERYSAALEVMRCLFSRSVEHSKYDLRHVCFEEYVAMLLNTKSYQRLLDTDLYEKLIADFGILSGINEKETIYYIPEKENFSDKNNLKIIEYYNQLNDIGKHEATKRVEELTHLPQYKLEQCNPNDNVLAAHAKDNQTDDDVASDIAFIKSLKQEIDKNKR